jgi:hypothetical protein
MASGSSANEKWSFWHHFWRTYTITLFIVIVTYIIWQR